MFKAVFVVTVRIVATPGRLMHILVEMNLKLQSVEYVVFDEADRLPTSLFVHLRKFVVP